jgi:hypothetical protein
MNRGELSRFTHAQEGMGDPGKGLRFTTGKCEVCDPSCRMTNSNKRQICVECLGAICL